MSGIIGSRLNHRGSGLVGSLGTDGQVFTSSGAGVGATYEAAAGGGKVLQVVQRTTATATTVTSHTTYGATDLYVAITPTLSTSKVLYMFNGAIRAYGSSETGVRNRTQIHQHRILLLEVVVLMQVQE